MELRSIALPDDGDVTDDIVEACNRDLRDVGYFYLRNVPDGFDYEDFVSAFGGLTEQYGGRMIWDLKPEPGMDDVYHSKNTQPLVPHTECYEFEGDPPRYLALWCIRPAEGEGGATTLADGYELLAQLAAHELEELYRRTYTWTSTEGLRRQGVELSAEHPVLERRSDGAPILRFSYNNMVPVSDDGFQRRFLERGGNFFAEHHFPVTIERNGLLLWDNHRMIHSRTGFVDRQRHLRRALLAARDRVAA